MSLFLSEPEPTPAVRASFAEDLEQLGFVMNSSRLWAYQPASLDDIFDVLRQSKAAGELTMRQMGILVTATASKLGDAYCSLAWGKKLSEFADEATAVGVLRGDDLALAPDEAALARWARKVVDDPNATTPGDVQELRDAGFGDAQIFAITVVVAIRLAFSTVNDALGAAPDEGMRTIIPESVQAAVTYGRPIEPATADGGAGRAHSDG